MTSQQNVINEHSNKLENLSELPSRINSVEHNIGVLNNKMNAMPNPQDILTKQNYKMPEGYAPTQPHHLADKKYVDDVVEAMSGTNPEHFVTHAQLDEALYKPDFIDLTIDEPVYHITEATLDSPKEIQLIEGKSEIIINQEDLDIASWKVDDTLKNEIYTDENGQKRIRENVGRITFNGSENWRVANDFGDVLRFIIVGYVNNSKSINKNYNNGMSNLFPLVYSTYQYNNEGFQITEDGSIYINILKNKLLSLDVNGFKQWLRDRYNEGNPLTVLYELAVKNPNSKVIESSDLYITSDYVRMVKPNDFSNNPNGLLISNLMDYVDRFEITTDWIYVYPKDITVAELGSQLVGKTLTYELAQPRLAKTEGIAGVVNPTIKDSNGHTLSLNGTYHKWDRAENRNGVWWDVIATNTAVIENPIDNGDYITIDKPSDLVSAIMIDGVESYIINETTIDLVTDLTIAELTGKEYIYNVTPTEKLSSVISKDDLDFSQGSTIYLESDTIALPKVDAKVAMDIAGQVNQLTKDSSNKSKKLHDHGQRIKANEIAIVDLEQAINDLNTEVSGINQTIANQVEGRIEQLEEALHDVEETLNLTQAELNQLQTDVTQVQENVTDISTSITAIQNELNNKITLNPNYYAIRKEYAKGTILPVYSTLTIDLGAPRYIKVRYSGGSINSPIGFEQTDSSDPDRLDGIWNCIGQCGENFYLFQRLS